MKLPLYQVDAFTDRLFGGNPAAVVPLQRWPDDALMQAVAAENNLAETAFFAPSDEEGADYQLRWFTPTTEVDLCGHATLASAWLLFNRLGVQADLLRFDTRSGLLTASRKAAAVVIDLPARGSESLACPAALVEGLGATPLSVRSGVNLMAVFATEAEIRAIQPDFRSLLPLHPQAVIVTAPGDDVDVVSRFFAPSFGIDEDPVTGSAHADLAPYWCERLQRTHFSARQLSARGGSLDVELDAERVRLTGQAVLYLSGTIETAGLTRP